MQNSPTIKQQAYVKRVVDRLGRDCVAAYLHNHFKNVSLDSLTRRQAQKVITGLGSYISKPIIGVSERGWKC